MTETKREILHLAVTAGETLLRNGAEIFRVEETISHILDAYDVRGYHLYVLSNGIFVSLDENDADNLVAVRNVPTASIHLGRIAAVNDLSRAVVRNPEPYRLPGYLETLRECASIPAFSLPLIVAASGVGSAGFCYLLGGSWLDAAAAFACGAALQLFLARGVRRGRSPFMPTIVGAALVSLLAVLFSFLWPVLSLDHMIIGAIIPLVPGVALTTSIRDFFNGDFLSGSIHLIEALLTGICIAVGVGVALQASLLLIERGPLL